MTPGKITRQKVSIHGAPDICRKTRKHLEPPFQVLVAKGFFRIGSSQPALNSKGLRPTYKQAIVSSRSLKSLPISDNLATLCNSRDFANSHIKQLSNSTLFKIQRQFDEKSSAAENHFLQDNPVSNGAGSHKTTSWAPGAPGKKHAKRANPRAQPWGGAIKNEVNCSSNSMLTTLRAVCRFRLQVQGFR